MPKIPSYCQHCVKIYHDKMRTELLRKKNYTPSSLNCPLILPAFSPKFLTKRDMNRKLKMNNFSIKSNWGVYFTIKLK